MPIPPPPKSKRICEQHLRGHCPRGARCHLSHGGEGGTMPTKNNNNSNNRNTISAASSSGVSAALANPTAQANNTVLVALLKIVFDVTGTNQNNVYNDGGHLNLSNFSEIGSLNEIRSQIDFNAVFFCTALCQVIKEKTPGAQFINVDSNNIRNLQVLLRALKDHGLVHVQGISACGNNISSTDFCHGLKGFKNLNELRLMGNPVTSNERYREAVRKALPDLTTLDGDSVHRPPLGLPWPQPPQLHSEDGQKLIACLADEFFAVAERRGPDGCITLYDEDAVFSLSVAPGAEMKAPEVSTQHPRRQDILKDFVTLRLAQNDRCRNIVTTRGPVRAVRGRADIGAALRACLYPRGVNVDHGLVNAGITAEFVPSQRGTIAMLTIHGTMSWAHSLEQTSDATVGRHYERTLAVVPDNSSPMGFYITNDCVHLRSIDANEPLWAGSAPGRLETLGRKYNIHPVVMQFVSPLVKSDLELHSIATTGLQGMDPDTFMMCVDLIANNSKNQNQNQSTTAASGGGLEGPHGNMSAEDKQNAVQVARVVSNFNVSPQTALNALQQVNFDVSAVKNAL